MGRAEPSSGPVSGRTHLLADKGVGPPDVAEASTMTGLRDGMALPVPGLSACRAGAERGSWLLLLLPP